MMYHEATACHVTGDLVELLSIFLSVLKSTRPYLQRKGLAIPISFLFVCLFIISSTVKEQNKAFKPHASENLFLSPVTEDGAFASHKEMLIMTSDKRLKCSYFHCLPQK